MIASGGKTWFTSAELADLALAGLPKSKRKVNERAQDECWALKVDDNGLPLARPRKGRGGGLEYHVSLLPAVAKAALVKRGIAFVADETAHVHTQNAQLWSWYAGQSDKVKAEAERRAGIVARVEAFEATRMNRTAAIANVAALEAVSPSTLWNWLKLIDGVAASDRLPQLAPRRQGGGKEAEIDPGAWQFFLSDYLRLSKPPLSECYYRLRDEYAPLHGIKVPHMRTLKRKVERDIDPRLVIAKREGMDALRQTLPPQKRTVAHLHAMEIVNIDGHKFDVFVRFPDGTIGRPIMVAIQDIYSRKILAWRIGLSENAVQTRLAFADLFRKFGIPKACVFDNGRAFASKWITGGAKSRFRFKIKEEEPTGIITAMGIQIKWATPYRGQSKPIERGFKDLCKTVSKHPAFEGAYTGNSTENKPENYGSKAVDFDVFVRIANKYIGIHNARTGRTTETALGKSFDQVFADSYAAAPIGKATEEQLRMALLTGEQLSTDRKNGAITIHGNRYWSAELSQIAGKRVTVRFDPDDLSQPIHVYNQGGQFLATAPVLEMTGFDDVASAKARSKQEAELRRAIRKAEEMEQLLTAQQVADMLPDYEDEAELPEPTVVRPVRYRGQTAAALKPRSEAAHAPLNDPFVDRFANAIGHLRVVE